LVASGKSAPLGQCHALFYLSVKKPILEPRNTQNTRNGKHKEDWLFFRVFRVFRGCY
jgi:hypothetical protein